MLRLALLALLAAAAHSMPWTEIKPADTVLRFEPQELGAPALSQFENSWESFKSKHSKYRRRDSITEANSMDRETWNRGA